MNDTLEIANTYYCPIHKVSIGTIGGTDTKDWIEQVLAFVEEHRACGVEV